MAITPPEPGFIVWSIGMGDSMTIALADTHLRFPPLATLPTPSSTLQIEPDTSPAHHEPPSEASRTEDEPFHTRVPPVEPISPHGTALTSVNMPLVA